MCVRVSVLDVFERGEDEFNNDELEARLEVRTTTRWSRRRVFGDDALEGLEEQCCALFDDDNKGGDLGNDKNAKKTKERKRRVSIQLRARFEGHDAPFRCG